MATAIFLLLGKTSLIGNENLSTNILNFEMKYSSGGSSIWSSGILCKVPTPQISTTLAASTAAARRNQQQQITTQQQQNNNSSSSKNKKQDYKSQYHEVFAIPCLFKLI